MGGTRMIQHLLNYHITTRESLYEILNILIEEIDRNLIKQVKYNNDEFCTEQDIHQIMLSHKLPDLLHCYFKDLSSNELYCLEVETYHGLGGTFKQI